jgi:hypothetical protein
MLAFENHRRGWAIEEVCGKIGISPEHISLVCRCYLLSSAALPVAACQLRLPTKAHKPILGDSSEPPVVAGCTDESFALAHGG